jgi:hypothetical protein
LADLRLVGDEMGLYVSGLFFAALATSQPFWTLVLSSARGSGTMPFLTRSFLAETRTSHQRIPHVKDPLQSISPANHLIKDQHVYYYGV